MVSTRGPKVKFSEGEKVLCYEPDSTKAKVLYDSKIKAVIETKDKRGRKSVIYEVHFLGWNPSWDRRVSEDFLLKDNEENRALQKELLEKSKLLLRERKKNQQANTQGAVISKSARTADDEGSSNSSQHEESGDETDSSSSNSAGPLKAQITLPVSLREYLMFDYNHIKKGHLTKIPASPTACQIINFWVQEILKQKTIEHFTKAPVPEISELSRQVNLITEVADGIRIYFDHIFKDHLLYNQELRQYIEIMGLKYSDNQNLRESNVEFEKNSFDDAKENISQNGGRNTTPCRVEQRVSPTREPSRRLRSTRSTGIAPAEENKSTQENAVASSNENESSEKHPENCPRRKTRRAADKADQAKMEQLLKRFEEFDVLPIKNKSHLPCSIYGAIHLTRLFVKLPDFLNATGMAETKLKLLLQYIHLVVEYISKHKEWFGIEQYT